MPEPNQVYNEDNDVLVQLVNRKMIITLNRPKTLNALTIPMIKALYRALKEVKDNHSADLVILKSSSEKAFCAGGDVLEIRKSVLNNGSMHKMFYVYEYIVDYMIGTLPVPFVALINGIAMGAGCGISVNGRFRVATEKTMVAMPEVGVGLFPDAGATYILPRLPSQIGMFISLTGHRLRGADVYYSGMATHYTSSDKIQELESALLTLSNPTNESVESVLKSFQPSQLPNFTLESNLQVINDAFSSNTLEEVLTVLEKSGTTFAKNQLNSIMKMNPISLKVTFHQLQLGKTLQFAEVFAFEYRLIQRLVSHPNFIEGSRALLIDRDNQPKWKPSRIEDVTEEDIQNHYKLLSNELDLNSKI